MKFEIELTEEEAKQWVQGFGDGSASDAITTQIRAQLPEEKSWQDRYKFLVGYILPDCLCAEVGTAFTSTTKTFTRSIKTYTFTTEMLVRAVIEICAEWRSSPFSMRWAQAVERFLEKQEKI